MSRVLVEVDKDIQVRRFKLYATRDGRVGRVDFRSCRSLARPTLEIDYDVAQTLMEQLWAAGVRPRVQDKDLENLLIRSYQAHLGDLREVLRAYLRSRGHSEE